MYQFGLFFMKYKNRLCNINLGKRKYPNNQWNFSTNVWIRTTNPQENRFLDILSVTCIVSRRFKTYPYTNSCGRHVWKVGKVKTIRLESRFVGMGLDRSCWSRFCWLYVQLLLGCCFAIVVVFAIFWREVTVLFRLFLGLRRWKL